MSSEGKPLRDIIASLDGARVHGDASIPIRSITFDSRTVEPGGLFVALRGGYADGHDYLPQARERGAVACLVDRDLDADSVAGYQAVVTVPDSRAALACVARTFYDEPSAGLMLVGITGTDGKTTTSFMLDHLLRRAGLTTGLIGTVAVRVGDGPVRSPGRQTTPESLETQRLLAEMRDAGVDVAILETSSHGLETHRVEGCRFDVGIITNITHEHLEFHGTVERYRAAKARLFDEVAAARNHGKLGVAILNRDDPGALAVIDRAGDCQLLTYGIESDAQCDVAASEIEPLEGGYRFKLRCGEQVALAHLPQIGRWNISNALAASAAAHALGIPVERIAAALEDFPGVPGRMQSIRAGQPFQVIVDYAHTAPALKLVLDAAREASSGKVLTLFGSAGERDVEKRAEMGAVAARCADYAIFTSEDPRFEPAEEIIAMIAEGALMSGAVEGVDFDRLEDRAVAIERILGRAGPGDVVVLAGKGHEQSILYGAEARPWDEARIARETLERLGYTETPCSPEAETLA